MRLLVSLWWALLFTLVSNIAAAEPCEDLIKMDGLLTQAKRVCPFSYYAFRFQLESKTCMEKKGKEERLKCQKYIKFLRCSFFVTFFLSTNKKSLTFLESTAASPFSPISQDL
jgi:hypothetical protein